MGWGGVSGVWHDSSVHISVNIVMYYCIAQMVVNYSRITNILDLHGTMLANLLRDLFSLLKATVEGRLAVDSRD